MNNNQNRHHRTSSRLKGYDYSHEGLYFISICILNRECLLGKIEKNNMILSETGEIANQYWKDITTHFPNSALHQHIIMPNHIHGIIEINHNNTMGMRHGSSLHNTPQQFGKAVSGSISVIINQYKSSVKRWCNQNDHSFF